jgi:hypothetical protein
MKTAVAFGLGCALGAGAFAGWVVWYFRGVMR